MTITSNTDTTTLSQASASEQPPPKTLNHHPERRGYALTDSGNAELLASLYKDILRYDHAARRWLVWREHWWTTDQDAEVIRLAKQAVRLRGRQAAEIEDEGLQDKVRKWARQSEALSRLKAAIELAQAEPQLKDDGTRWDSNSMLLGLKNGVLDLRTGRLRHGRPSDYITLHADISFDAKAQCPRWRKFIEEIFGGELALIDYVHKAVGYSITGSTQEQVIFLCYGTGANGKSTFLEVMRHVLGSYAYNLPFSAFEMKARSPISNDIAALPHKRFVTALETNELSELNESRIKALTGCDPITARFLYRENFTFVPDGKFWLAFNHKPRVSDDSHGFWRRVRLIPFLKEFSDKKRDSRLLETLRPRPPELNWLVQGP